MEWSSTARGGDGAGSGSISVVEYDRTGEFIATGDTNGNISLFKIELGPKHSATSPDQCLPHFHFVSHTTEMDYLKSEAISPKICRIRFCDSVGDTKVLLTANEKTIKLWKVGRKVLPTSDTASRFVAAEGRIPTIRTSLWSQTEDDQSASDYDDRPVSDVDGLPLPSPPPSRAAATNYSRSSSPAYRLHPYCRNVFADAHTYHINSLSCCMDGQTFLSADDLRIYWWHLDRSDTCFNMIDIKPANMNELKEVITAAHFHPVDPHMMAYSTSRGLVRVYDTRASATFDCTHRVYRDESAAYRSFSTIPFVDDVMNSISDMTYSRDGRHLIVRDYLTVKVYDLSMESSPVYCVSLHDYLQPVLPQLMSRDAVFDKFEVCCSWDGSKFATGSYSNLLKVYLGPEEGMGQLEIPSEYPLASMESPVEKQLSTSGPSDGVDEDGLHLNSTTSRGDAVAAGYNSCDPFWAPSQINVEQKLLHCAWHPLEDVVAVAGPLGLQMFRV